MTTQTYPLFCMGNPLLDMQVHGEELLKKYNLNANDAILAGPEHFPMCAYLSHRLNTLKLTQIHEVTRRWSRTTR